MFELRWYNGVLQFRKYETYTDYSCKDPDTGEPFKFKRWKEWEDVPIVKEDNDDKTS